ncbi:putative transposase, Ptta/En/Spm, plant [Helianthus debilis subsp. tardiflorus]
MNSGGFFGEYRSEFSSFLGDLVREYLGFRFLGWKKVSTEVRDKLWEEITRFYDIEACRRHFVMVRLGHMLRNFRRKVYAGYIVPNLSKPKKLAQIPRRYRSMVEQTDWDKFVTYTQSKKFKDVSEKTKKARSKYVYDHHLGRGGYAYLREKLVQNNELSVDEIPSRALMWRKARENKNGEYKNVVKDMADKLIESETQIKDGALNLDPGMDALTVVFGKEKGGFVKGVGYGVTSSKYWQGPQTKGSSKERIAQLKFQLHNESLERGKKDEEIKTLSMQMAETNNTLNQLLAHLAAQGQRLPIRSLSADKMCQTQVNSVDKHVGSTHNASATASKIVQKEMATTVNSMDNNPGSKDNANVTTSNLSSQVVQTKVTPHVTTSKMAPKEIITTENVKIRKKDVLSMDEASFLGSSSHLESQENIHNTHSANVLEKYKCTLYTLNLNNCVGYGTIHLSMGKQSIHCVPLQDDCYKVSIDKVTKAAAFLPVESGELKTVGDALNTFVAWPKSLVKTSEKIPNLSSIQTKNTTNQMAKKQKRCFTTLDDITKKTRSKKNMKTL